MQHIYIRTGTALWLGLPQQLLAESAADQGFTPPPSIISTESMLQLSTGLLMVLAFIALIAWLFKKIGFHPANRTGLLKIISSASVGQRERIVLAEIGDIWLVLGVAPGQINLLYQMDKKTLPVSEATDSPLTSHFTEELRAHLERGHER